MTLAKLTQQARRACEWRGHKMGEWSADDYWKRCRKSTCQICGMGVWVDPRPAPNGIDISGEAVALDCRKAV